MNLSNYMGLDVIHVKSILEDIIKEVESTTVTLDPLHSTYEAWSEMRREVDELWYTLRKDGIEKAQMDATQIASMAIRFLLCSRCTELSNMGKTCVCKRACNA